MRGRDAADRTRRLVAVDDVALRHHHRDLRAGVERQGFAIEEAEVVLHRHLAEAVFVRVFDPALDQQVAHFVLGLEVVDQFLLQREPAEIAADVLDQFADVVDISLQLRRVELAEARDVGEVALPEIVHPEQVGLARLGRLRIEDVGFGRGLELAHAEQVHVDAELVLQAFAEITAVTRQAFEHHSTIRMQVDLVGRGREVVLVLLHVVGVGHDLFAAFPEVEQRVADLAHGGHADTGDLVRAHHDALDARVGGGALDRTQDVAQLGLGLLLVHRAG